MSRSQPDYLPNHRLFSLNWEDLSNLDILALLIGPGVSDQRAFDEARRLLDRLEALCCLKDVTYGELRRDGLGHRRSLALLAACHLARRINRVALYPRQRVRSSLEVVRHFRAETENLKKECFWNVMLDGKNCILKVEKISEGSLTSSLVHPREVFRPAILEASAGVLFVHNHPSGDPAPSAEDIEITRRLVETGKIIGIRVLDHVIMGDSRYFSFADQGLM